MAAAAGRVTSQTRKMFDATLKSSPLWVCFPRVDPATAEEWTWVVETGGADAAAEEDDQSSRELGGESLARNDRSACVGLGSIHGVDGYDAAASSLSFPT
jgi:hypothetical protein